MVGVAQNSETMGLARWRVSEIKADNELVFALQNHPLFAKAARRLSENTLAAAARDKALDGMVKDLGRYSAAGLAVYLDASGGLTLPRLKEVCAQLGLASPGRARATLLYLRFLNYVEPAAGGGRSRATIYVPTRAMMNTWQTLSSAAIDAAEILEPELGIATQHMTDMRVTKAFLRNQGELGLFMAAVKYPEPEFWPVFLHRHAGMQIAHALMLGAGEDDDYPPRKPLPLSITDLSRRFAVSRSHVVRMLQAAERRNLIARGEDGTVTLLEPARTAIRELIALRFFATLVCAERALAQTPDFQPELRADRIPGPDTDRPIA
jgi:DNA-binding MarR family transcriptional regulator